MSAAPPTVLSPTAERSPAPGWLALLTAQATQIRRHFREEHAIGFHVPGIGAGDDTLPQTLAIDGEELRFAVCPSPLAVRAALAEGEEAGAATILVTDRTDRELGNDVLARLTRRRLFRLNAWEALRERLGVREIDPRLQKLAWLPDLLLAIAVETDYRAAGSALDADEAWRLLLTRVGFDRPRPDLGDLLLWTQAPANRVAYASLAAPARAAYAERLAEWSRPAGLAVLRLVGAERGEDAIPLGLVLEALLPKSAAAGFDAESAKAVGRLEAALLGGATLDPAAARAWALAAIALVKARRDAPPATGETATGEAAIAPWLDRAERLLAELKIESFGGRSTWLQAGYAARSARFVAVALEVGRAASGPSLRSAAEDLAERAAALTDHGRFAGRPGDQQGVRAMVRLARALSAPAAPAGSFSAAVAAYAGAGSFFDRARSALADAQLSSTFGPARDALLAAATTTRETENRRFAELLQGWLAAGGADAPAAIPLDRVLDRIAAPLARERPLLMLVVDGLSFAIFRELAEDLAARGWTELFPEEAPQRLAGVALLPSVTAVCRTSLFCGAPRFGNANVEMQGFAAHPGLRQAGGQAPVLFHKGDLHEGGAGLAPAVRQEIERKARRVVGLVANVIDDQLPKGSQLIPRWSIDRIRDLPEILAAAAAAGRTLLIAADHGHLPERASELRRAEGGGSRHRPATSGAAPGDGEIALRGERVLAGDGNPGGGELIAAWSERLRYGALQGGYHGGASPQEVVVPLSVWVARGAEVPGWRAAPNDDPDFWPEVAAPGAKAAPVAMSPARPKAKLRPADEAQSSLFAPPATSAPAPAPPAWLAALFASPVYAEQRARTERLGLDDRTVARALEALASHGGKLTLAALARQLEVAPARAHSLAAALQRRLNVEGFAVLTVISASETVTFDLVLLSAQFLSEEGS